MWRGKSGRANIGLWWQAQCDTAFRNPWHHRMSLALPKAPPPLRSAGAVQNLADFWIYS